MIDILTTIISLIIKGNIVSLATYNIFCITYTGKSLQKYFLQTFPAIFILKSYFLEIRISRNYELKKNDVMIELKKYNTADQK